MRIGGKMEYSLGEMGNGELAAAPQELMNQQCIAGTVADAENSQ